MKLVNSTLSLVLLLSVTSCEIQRYVSLSSPIEFKKFNLIIDTKQTQLIKISNNNRLELFVTNYGARIVSLMVPDKSGNFDDIVCGFDNIVDYKEIKQNYGAVVGRYIGRILGAKFTIDNREYKLQAGTHGHCSHGGEPGFANRMWDITQLKEDMVTLSYLSVNGENGFPGNLTIYVTYRLTSNNELVIEYSAKSDKPTVLNPSNHSFFNISGKLYKSVESQFLWIDSDSIAEYDSKKCVTGRMIAVKNSPFDFNKGQCIGNRIDEKDEQLIVTGGYDHTWKLKNDNDIKRVVSKIIDKGSGRIMEVYTTEPGLHIYTANGHNGKIKGKSNILYPKRNSICFETMHFADSPNKPQYPSTLLNPGDEFKSTTIFKFKTVDNF